MKVVLISRLDDAEALAFTAGLAEFLSEQGYGVVMEQGTADALDCEGRPFSELDGDLAVVIGGDGSVLLAVQQMPRQIPVVGVNHSISVHLVVCQLRVPLRKMGTFGLK